MDDTFAIVTQNGFERVGVASRVSFFERELQYHQMERTFCERARLIARNTRNNDEQAFIKIVLNAFSKYRAYIANRRGFRSQKLAEASYLREHNKHNPLKHLSRLLAYKRYRKAR